MRRACLLWISCSCLLAQDSPAEVRVAYTGRLLGYARTPDMQVLTERPGSPGLYEHRDLWGPASPVAAALREQVARFRSSGGASLLLGLGDNFAMDFRARAVLLQGTKGSRWARKDQLVYDAERKGWADLNEPRTPAERQRLERMLLRDGSPIDFDNVAEFLSDLGFDALVPGKQDFYFGPQRLRQLGRLLSEAKRPVPLLASNLVVRAVSTRPQAVKPAAQLDAMRGFVSRHPVVAWNPPSAPLPWMRRVRLRRAFTDGKANYAALRWCPASNPLRPCPETAPALVALADPNPRQKDWDAWVYATPHDALVFTREELRKAESRAAPPPVLNALHEQIRQLEATRPVRLVDPLEPDGDYTACVYFSGGERPYCSTIRIARPLFDHSQNLRRPYAVRHGTVILGAVAQGIERSVGVMNSQWLHTDPSVDAGVVSVDPAEALSQTIEYCLAMGDCNAESRYLLLAQMAQPDAEVLNRRLRNPFLAVFAEPDAYDATSSVPVEYPGEHAALTFVPPPVYTEGEVRVSLRTALFRRPRPGTRHEVVTGAAPVAAVRTRDEGPDCLSKRIEAVGALPKDARQFPFLVLHAMRRAGNADAAILQKRDLFELDQRAHRCPDDPAAVEPERIAVEGVLWKGDLLAVRTITGAQLKGILAQSDAYDGLDRDPYSQHGSPNQGLLTLGLLRDSGVWFVNGQAVSDNRLYTVAMPDFLAFGDTGYADLRRQPVPPAMRLPDLSRKELTPIADLVLAELGLARPSRLPAEEYLDRTDQAPPNGVIRATYLEQLRELARRWTVPYPAFRPGTPEAFGQSRNYWRFFADQGSIGYSEYRNNQPSAAEISRRFKGITESGVNSRESRTWVSAAQIELRREALWGNLFSRFETGYASQVLQASSAGGELTRNYLDNRISSETGVRRAVWGNARQRPWTGFIAALQVTSQLRRPFELLPGAAQAAPIPRTSRAAGKFGLRMEGRQNWIESGVLTGWVHRPRPDLTGSLEQSATNRENGMFLNFNAGLQLPRGIGIREFNFSNRMQFYWARSSDIAVDTRLIERFEASVQLPVWGNISLRPTWGLFLFENKRSFHFLSGRTFSIRLDYRFDRSSGASWRQVAGFGRP